MENKNEVRFLCASQIEVRAALDSGLVPVVGYASVFNEVADIGGFWDEVVAPGAFSATLAAGDDVAFLIDHEGLPLARTRSGTLRLSQDTRGLRVEADLDPSDPDVQRILPKMRRGDLTAMSFAFRTAKNGDYWDESKTPPLRTLLDLTLRDVAIVTFPAYAGADIALRSRAAAQSCGAHNFATRARMRLKLDA
jgi:HK97 family phage prohead protease